MAVAQLRRYSFNQSGPSKHGDYTTVGVIKPMLGTVSLQFSSSLLSSDIVEVMRPLDTHGAARLLSLNDEQRRHSLA